MTPLTDSQKQAVAAWLAGGLKIGEIQKRLEAEFSLRMTYLEVRCLLDDLKLMPKDPEPPKPEAPKAQPAQRPGTGPADEYTEEPDSADLASPPPAGGITVTVDQLARPGALVSGGVTFRDGQQAQWYLDQMGRLGLAPKQQGYRPPPADVQEFQVALERELRKMGL